ncbi:MAG: toll/interleukin-1 receptor domain-containing protein, partial [Anaerolineae bacterium]|nr:toll/interleukin-1 receptor domain-containing protein [Anaerolineae bacterium]
MPWKTFLSYSRSQYYFAESLVLRLQASGLAVWFDVQQLEPGSDWQRDIAD